MLSTHTFLSATLQLLHRLHSCWQWKEHRDTIWSLKKLLVFLSWILVMYQNSSPFLTCLICNSSSLDYWVFGFRARNVVSKYIFYHLLNILKEIVTLYHIFFSFCISQNWVLYNHSSSLIMMNTWSLIVQWKILLRDCINNFNWLRSPKCAFLFGCQGSFLTH